MCSEFLGSFFHECSLESPSIVNLYGIVAYAKVFLCSFSAFISVDVALVFCFFVSYLSFKLKVGFVIVPPSCYILSIVFVLGRVEKGFRNLEVRTFCFLKKF